MTKIRCEDNTITRDEKKILSEQAKFYRKLYSKDPLVKFVMENKSNVKFNDENAKQIDEEFTFEEFTQAARSMARNKAPGNSELPIEFYITFWTRIGKMVLEAMSSHIKEGTCIDQQGGASSVSFPRKEKIPC